MALTKISRSLLDTGISDSSDATAITIDSSEKTTFSGDVEVGTTAPKINLKNTDTSIVADQSLGVIEIESTDGSTGSAGTIAKLDIAASGAFDGSGHGSQYRFSTGATNQSGSIALTEQMRLSDVGNLHLSGGSDRRIQLGSGGAGANQVSNNTVHIRGDGTSMKLMTASGGSYLFEENGTEVMRIATGGDVRIGTSTQGAATVLTVSGTSSGGNGAAAITGTADNGPALNLRKTSTTTSSDARFIQFAANSGSTAMGGIGGNGASNAQFITLSDEREKENITPVVSVLDKIMNLNVVSFDWIKHDEHIKAGFIAQNVEKYFPEYVVENVSNEGEEERKGTTGGMSAGYIAVLTKAIQEQQEQIEALQSEINLLKGE